MFVMNGFKLTLCVVDSPQTSNELSSIAIIVGDCVPQSVEFWNKYQLYLAV